MPQTMGHNSCGRKSEDHYNDLSQGLICDMQGVQISF